MTATQNDKKQNNISNDNKKGKSNNKEIAIKSFHLITIIFLPRNHFLLPPSVSERRRRLIKTPLNQN